MATRDEWTAELRPLELAAVNLWDSGLSVEQIAARLRKSRESISSALSIATGGSDHIMEARANRIATQQLGAAIIAYHERNAA